MPAGAFGTPRVTESLKALKKYLEDAHAIASNIGHVDYTSREADRAKRRARKKAKTAASVKRRALPPKS